MTILWWVFWLATGYLLGSLPVGYFVAKMKGIDMRTVGSRSTGTANVARQFAWRYGMIVLLGDMAKCLLLVLLVRWTTPSVWLQVWVVAATMMGSIFPVFLHFKGGKGVAVLFGGSILLLSSWAMLFLFLLWFGLVFATKKMSATNMLTVFGGMIFLLLPGSPLAYGTFGIFATGVIFFSHRENITRLLKHQEPNVSFKL